MKKTPNPLGRSTDIRDHAGLITLLARRYYARVRGAKIPGVDFEDVRSALGVAFVYAARGYNTDAENTFTAFFGMCAQRHINKWLGKLCKEQYGDPLPGEDKVESNANFGPGLGMLSIEELGGDLCGSALDDSASPEDRLDAKQKLTSIINNKRLLTETRAYIAMLANPSLQTEHLLGRVSDNWVGVREEVKSVFGVDLGRQ